MIKSVFRCSRAAVTFPRCSAGPYVNVESNSGFGGSDYEGTLPTHIGFEGTLGEDVSWYVQGGASRGLLMVKKTPPFLSGKVGLGVALTRRPERLW